jgi:tetratricopeptide (TPR) repeat protein
LKKAVVYLDGNLYEKGEVIMPLPRSDDMTYYISSLSSLADGAVKYRMIVLERTVYDNTRALIDFAQGRSSVDTLLGDNASELRRVRKCIDDVFMLNELVLDSLVISASCSPEGSYRFNAKLAESRSRAVCDYISEYVPEEFKDSLRASSIPENWEQLRLLVSNDTVMGSIAVEKIMSVTQDLTKPDETERKLSLLPQYRYLREKVYPKLRSVKFEFYLHRAGMVKDTVHTTEVDTVYMAGIQALRDLDYKRAVSLLRPYGDYNSALAFMSAEYNHSALDVLQKLDDTDPKVCYLMAMVLSRLEQNEMAQMYFKRALAYDPYLRHRANLDPEMSKFVTDIEEEY